MIEINLLPGGKKKRGGKGLGLKLPDFAGLVSSVKDPWLIAAIAVWAIVLALLIPFYVRRGAQVHALEPQIEKLKRDSTQLASVLAQRRRMEQQRDQLLAEIQVIRDIDRDRYIWPHILDAVAKAVPQYTWLNDLAARPGETDSTGGPTFTIQGETADPQALTRFMRNLEESPYITSVTLIQSALVSEQQHDVTSFTLSAHFQQPPPSLLTMEPLATSIVRGVRSGGGARR